MSSGVRVRCFAKINTVLRVVGRRPDGFHDLDTEFVSLELADDLEIERAEGGFELQVSGAPASEVPVADNLVLRAARLLQSEAGPSRLPGALMRLHKAIPAAAGLGGGSSDAAGALEGLDRLFDLRVPRARLEELALQVGSDVPYFLRGGRQRGRGRGEQLEGLPDRPDVPVVLLKPRLALSTARVFQEHARLAAEHPDRAFGRMLTSRKNDLTVREQSWWGSQGFVAHDDLADAAVGLAPEVAQVARAAEQAFPDGIVGMTGSGPTLFVLLPGGLQDAEARLQALRPLADAWVTRTLGSAGYAASRFG